MTNRYWLPITFLIAGFCFFCYSAPTLAQFPKPRPAAAPQATAAPVQAPPVQVAPSEVASPPVVVAAPTTMDEIKSWINTAIASIIALLLGKIGFRPAAPVTPVAGVPTLPDEANVLLKLRDRVTDPELLGKIDNTLLTVVATGVPGKFVQSGLSMVPGVGPLLSGAEPMLREAFMDFLKAKIATRTP